MPNSADAKAILEPIMGGSVTINDAKTNYVRFTFAKGDYLAQFSGSTVMEIIRYATTTDATNQMTKLVNEGRA